MYFPPFYCFNKYLFIFLPAKISAEKSSREVFSAVKSSREDFSAVKSSREDFSAEKTSQARIDTASSHLSFKTRKSFPHSLKTEENVLFQLKMPKAEKFKLRASFQLLLSFAEKFKLLASFLLVFRDQDFSSQGASFPLLFLLSATFARILRANKKHTPIQYLFIFE